MGRDWVDWHRGYDDPDRSLSARLAVVRGLIRTMLDEAPPGPIPVVSLCAGDGRDLLGAAADHPRRPDIVAHLVELDPALVGAARRDAARIGLDARVVEGDAARTATIAGAVPADLVLLCGIFGNVSDDDVQTTIAAVPMLCRPGATVLWTRHRWPPDLTPAVRAGFDRVGATALAFESPGPGGFAVGAERFGGAPQALDPDLTLFRFVDRSR